VIGCTSYSNIVSFFLAVYLKSHELKFIKLLSCRLLRVLVNVNAGFSWHKGFATAATWRRLSLLVWLWFLDCSWPRISQWGSMSDSSNSDPAIRRRWVELTGDYHIIIIIIIHEYYYGGAVALLLQDHLTMSVTEQSQYLSTTVQREHMIG